MQVGRYGLIVLSPNLFLVELDICISNLSCASKAYTRSICFQVTAYVTYVGLDSARPNCLKHLFQPRKASFSLSY